MWRRTQTLLLHHSAVVHTDGSTAGRSWPGCPLTGRAALSPRTPISLGVKAHHHHHFLKQILSQYEVVFHVLRQNKCKIKLETI